MRPYRFASPAYRDLAGELEYLNNRSPAAAGRFLSDLDRRLRLLAKFPHMGRKRPEFGHADLRFLAFGAFLLAYDPETRPLTVIALRHTARDPRQIFQDL